ncbi:MAG: phosphoheptose isomerase [Actinobacteria bacterium]|nr:phosphoheptose isomerase [Actinomycetota bacterium]
MSETAVPVLLPVNQFDHFYRGGDRIGKLRRGPGGPQRPEEWIGSTTARFGQAPQGFSTLPDGRLLVAAIDDDPVAWLGEAHVARYGSSTEVLVKLLDLDQRLPVHLHPNRSFAKTHLGLAHGKTEAWYVLEAPEGAEVGVGFKDTMTLQQVDDWVRDRDSAALLSALRTRVVRPGDAMLVPAGLPHTVQEGVFVLELQEPTDLSILLEWQDFAVDGAKDGHLDLGFETALQAVDLAGVSDSDLDRLVVTHDRISAAGLASVMPAQADPYFRAHRLDSSAGPVGVDAGFAIVLVLGGSGVIHSDAASFEVARGDVALIPFAAGDWRLDGEATAVACRPPAPDAPMDAR